MRSNRNKSSLIIKALVFLIAQAFVTLGLFPCGNSQLAKADTTMKISGLINGVNDYKIMAAWNTDAPARSELYYRKEGYTDYLKVSNNDLKTAHRLETPKLGAGNYDYYIISVSGEGQSQRSQILYAKTADFSAPVLPTGGQTLSTSPPKRLPTAIKDPKIYASIRGKIIMRVEKKGQAYYVSPSKQEMYYLGRPDDAFAVMRQLGIGISNANLDKIGVSLKAKPSGADKDGDGLSDMMEDASGTDKAKKDTDGDGHSDKSELEGAFNPLKGGNTKMPIDSGFAQARRGWIFLATERHGEAWYVSPGDSKRYFLGRPADALAVMRAVGTGISEANFSKL